MYTAIFRGKGARSIVHLPVPTREDADDSDLAATAAHVRVFSSREWISCGLPAICPDLDLIAPLKDHFRGGTLAGTSAGAGLRGHDTYW